MGSPAGALLSTLVIEGVSKASGDSFTTWGWRVPFLLSAVLLIAGLVIRAKLPETPAFRRVEDTEVKHRQPLAEVIRGHSKTVVIVAGLGFSNNIVYYIASVFTLSYATTFLDQSRDSMLANLMVVSAILLCAIPFMAMVADRFGPRRVVMTISGVGALLAFPYFMLVNTGDSSLILLGMIAMAVFVNGGVYAPQPAFLASLFPPQVRYTGTSIGYALPTMLIGGTAPFVGTALYAWAGDTWPISLYMALLCLVSLVCAHLTRHLTHYTDTPESADTAAANNVTSGRE